jgi:hypothetical protein
LPAYYKLNHELVKNKYSLSEIEEMIPYERDLTIDMILADEEKKNAAL